MVTMDGYTLTFYGGIEQIMNLLKTACGNIEKINPTFYFSLLTSKFLSVATLIFKLNCGADM
jgi:hypothetical protein